MFRDENHIYHTKGYGGNHTIECIRPPKLSERRRKLQRSLATEKMFLRHVKDCSKKESEERKRRIESLERQLTVLPQTMSHKTKRTYKKMSLEKIKEYALEKIEEAKKNNVSFIVAEDVAYHLNVKPHFVKQVFQQLNLEGVLSQPSHHIPHDSNRDPMCNGTYSGWSADIYYILRDNS